MNIPNIELVSEFFYYLPFSSFARAFLSMMKLREHPMNTNDNSEDLKMSDEGLIDSVRLDLQVLARGF